MKIVVTHQNSDLDALASLVAAQRLYPDAVAVRGKTVSPYVRRYLALHKDEVDLTYVGDVDPEQVDHVIIVDVRNARRLRDYDAIFERDPRITVFDHHPASPDDVIADEETVDPVGACATILAERLQEAGVELNESDATLMLLGIYADTGSLTFDSTTPRDVEAAAWLLRNGARLSVVNLYLQQQFTPEQQKLLVDMMAHTEEYSVDSVEVAFSVGHADDYVRGAADVVEHIMRFGGHDAIFGIIDFDEGKRIQAIGRSRVPYVDVGTFLSEIGGGGHAGAGAATFKDSSVDEVAGRLRELLSEADLRPTRVRDLMTSPVETIDRAETLERARELLDHWNVSGAPALKDGELEGIVSRRDIARAAESGKLDLPVASHMSHNPKTIGPDEPLEDALDMMTEEDVGRLPVLEDGRMIGIVTRTDILNRLYEGNCEQCADMEQ